MAKVTLTIPKPYNGGEYRVSQKVTGPRGGQKFQRVYSTPATGGQAVIDLEPGIYKETWWANGFPKSQEFVVDENGAIIEKPNY